MNNNNPAFNLYGWQNECLEKWVSNNCRGIVNAATGAGKTMLAAAAIKLLTEKFGGEKLLDYRA